MGDEDRTLLIVVAVIALLVVGSIVAVLAVPVIGSFLLGQSDSEFEAAGPQVSMSLDREGEQVSINHTGGDSLDSQRVVVTVGNESATWVEWGGDDGQIENGDSLTVEAAIGTQFEIVYQGEQDVTLFSGTV